MLNLKLLSLALLIGVGISLPLQAEQDFDLSAGKFGLAFSLCDSKNYKETEEGYRLLTLCKGIRLSYVEKSTNLVLSFSYATDNFKDSFIEKYSRTSVRMGYRINFDTWIRKFWDRDIFILSSLYVTIYALELYRNDTFTTRDYQFKRSSYLGPYFTGEDLNFSGELGWKINDRWDVFTATESTQLGPFLFPQKDGLVKKKLNATTNFIGFHYSFK